MKVYLQRLCASCFIVLGVTAIPLGAMRNTFTLLKSEQGGERIKKAVSSPYGRYVAYKLRSEKSDANTKIEIYDTKSGEMVDFYEHTYSSFFVKSMCFSQNEQYFASGAWPVSIDCKGDLIVYDLKKKEKKVISKGNLISDINFSPNEKFLVASERGGLIVYNIENKKSSRYKLVNLVSTGACKAHISVDGAIIIGTTDEACFMYDIKNKKRTLFFDIDSEHSEQSGTVATVVSMNKSANLFACILGSKGLYELRVYDIKTGQLLFSKTDFGSGWPYDIAFSPHNTFLVVVDKSSSSRVVLWDITKQSIFTEFGLLGHVESFCFNEDGRYLFFVYAHEYGRSIAVYNVYAKKRIECNGIKEVYCEYIRYNNDDEQIVLFGEFGGIMRYQVPLALCCKKGDWRNNLARLLEKKKYIDIEVKTES